MKFSYRWLSEMVPGLSAKPEQLERLITMKTAECEGIERWGEHFERVIAVRVLGVEALPKGKNQTVVIDAGDGVRHLVVCGAPNVRPGMIAAWVPPGTNLFGKQIGLAVIDGIESDGMLASGEELGINRDGDGLLELALEPGSKLMEGDWIIEIDNKSLTHRPDLWGHFGMAREVAAITHGALRDPVTQAIPAGHSPMAVEIEDYPLCPRYSALLFENVAVGPSPLWLQARLQAVGINPINNIVDITNYVLAELPQPMHAFDADRLRGGTIFVRQAHAGETLLALNEETYTLTAADLVIADSDGAVALAGVIGGDASAISETTTRILLESANFGPTGVRLTSSRHKLRTDASMRFEKSLDPANTVRGLARALELLQIVCPGIRLVGGVVDVHSIELPSKVIQLPLSLVIRKLGKEMTEAEVSGILTSLGFTVDVTAPAQFVVTVPSWRATKDIDLKEDLVEEIGRMVGYGEIAPRPPLVAAVVPPANPFRLYARKVRQQLAAQGFSEAYNYSFVNEAQWKRFGLTADDHLAVTNPIASELTHMRRSLLPGVLDTIVKNSRNFREVRFFEIGREIQPRPASLPNEVNHLVAALFGGHADEQEFFELKRVAECVFPGLELTAAEPLAWEHPVRAAQMHWRGRQIGRLFELHPLLVSNEKLEGRAFLFDVDLDLAGTRDGEAPTYRPLRKHPTSGFDLSVIADMSKPVAQIQLELSRLGGEAVVSIEFVRQYAGVPLDSGQKSVSYHLEIGAPQRTLTSDEVNEVRAQLINGMRAAGYDLRV